jgi:DNA-binding XRE family transcriptional regulator
MKKEKKEIIENYIFTGLGIPVLLPFAVFKENARGVKYLDVDMKELKNKVALSLMMYRYAYTGAMLNFIRNYLGLSTIQMAEILDISQQTVTNWETKKREGSLSLSEKQRSYLVLKLRQCFFNQKETEINEAMLNSRQSSKELHEEPLIIDELSKTG